MRPDGGRVARAVEAPAQRVWAALTDPALVRRWWGELSPAPQVGRLSQLSVASGDVYALEVFRLEPPSRLEYGRRYFAIDAKETVAWEVAPLDGGCLVSVEYRSSAYEEWLYHTDRLARCARGEPVPPAPPDREFRLGTDLPGDPPSIEDRLLRHLEQLSPPGGTWVTRDGLRLELDDPAWLSPTSARLAVTRHGQGTRLSVRHRGWEGTAFDGAQRAAQRARLARFWHRFFLRFTLEVARSWQIPTLSATDLRDRMARPEVVVLDANRQTLWARGHVPEAVFVGQEDLPVDRLPPDKAAELVFYCRDRMCLTAYLSAAKARTLGYPNTFVMEGGREAWAESGFPLVPDGEVRA